MRVRGRGNGRTAAGKGEVTIGSQSLPAIIEWMEIIEHRIGLLEGRVRTNLNGTIDWGQSAEMLALRKKIEGAEQTKDQT